MTTAAVLTMALLTDCGSTYYGSASYPGAAREQGGGALSARQPFATGEHSLFTLGRIVLTFTLL